MSFKKYQSHKANHRFVIKEDLPEVGCYLYVYDATGKCVADHLQDNLNSTMEFAQEEFNIEKDSWQLIDD